MPSGELRTIGITKKNDHVVYWGWRDLCRKFTDCPCKNRKISYTTQYPQLEPEVSAKNIRLQTDTNGIRCLLNGYPMKRPAYLPRQQISFTTNDVVMNNLRNHVQLIGCLGKEVEYKQLESGNAIARVSLSTKEVYQNGKGERVIDVQWHQLVGWGKIAEIMQVLLAKGKEVAVQGKLTHRTFEDKEGNTRYTTEVIVNEFMLLN